MTKWIMAIGIATFLLVLAIAVLLLVRQRRRTETEVILDAIDGVRIQVETDTTLNAFEHEAITGKLDKANGRLQFLMAKDIAEEIATVRAAVTPPGTPKDAEPL